MKAKAVEKNINTAPINTAPIGTAPIETVSSIAGIPPKRSLIHKVGRSCKFDKIKDYQKVESGLSCSLSEVLKTGVVKESSITLESNGIDDPEKVVGMVKNRFDAIEAERAIRKYGKKAEVGQYTTQVEIPKVSE